MGLRLRYIADKMSLDGFGGSLMGRREVGMSVIRRLVAVGAVATLALVGAGSAFAATPQKIYRDLADNGRLDAKYTRAEIERAFNLPQALRTDVQPAAPRKPIADPSTSEAAQSPRATGRTVRRVPFSALDAALLVAGGGPLLLIGAGLRRRLAPVPNEARARVTSA
jgi:hypothetical protein